MDNRIKTLIAQSDKIFADRKNLLNMWQEMAETSIKKLVESGRLTRESLDMLDGSLMQFRSAAQ